jgi:hypothetical protein
MVRRLFIFLVLFVSAHSAPALAEHVAHNKLQLATSAAFAADGSLWIVGVERGQLFVRRQLGDGSWQTPRVIDNAGEVVATNGDNRPKIAFGPNGTVVVTYTRPLAKPYTGEIRMLRSHDGGASFSAPFTVHQDRQIITHRFESLMFDARGDLYTIWIDKRDAERAWAAANGDQEVYPGAAVYYNVSVDQGKTFGPDTKLADYSCECCRIAVVSEPNQGVAVMWRHVFPGSVRDHAFARISRKGGSTLQRASTDQWILKACPHHGPGLAIASTGGYHTVWFGEREGKLRARYGKLDQQGRPVGEAIELPDALADHADVVSVGKRVIIVWRVFDGERTHLRTWVSDDDGRSFRLVDLRSTQLENDHPRLAVQGNRMVVVWRTENETYVEDLR